MHEERDAFNPLEYQGSVPIHDGNQGPTRVDESQREVSAKELQLARLQQELQQATSGSLPLPSVIEAATATSVQRFLELRTGRLRRIEAEMDQLQGEILSEEAANARGEDALSKAPDSSPDQGGRPARTPEELPRAGRSRTPAPLSTNWCFDRARRWGMPSARRRSRRSR